MELTFYKYQGTGNDFVMVDNRKRLIPKNDTKLINRLCDRKFGIGADGLILLEEAEEPGMDFRMVYFNADGAESSMCGNGGRCIISFANFLGLIEDSCSFLAIDGKHDGIITEDGIVGLKMNEVKEMEEFSNYVFLNTGSPHHVVFTEEISQIDIRKEGAAIRYSEPYKGSGGTNVNFVEVLDGSTLRIRTYERGVENETLSCGTGATAAAIAAYSTGKIQSQEVDLKTEGGNLRVRFSQMNQGYTEIWLEGPTQQVFKGTMPC